MSEGAGLARLYNIYYRVGVFNDIHKVKLARQKPPARMQLEKLQDQKPEYYLEWPIPVYL